MIYPSCIESTYPPSPLTEAIARRAMLEVEKVSANTGDRSKDNGKRRLRERMATTPGPPTAPIPSQSTRRARKKPATENVKTRSSSGSTAATSDSDVSNDQDELPDRQALVHRATDTAASRIHHVSPFVSLPSPTGGTVQLKPVISPAFGSESLTLTAQVALICESLSSLTRNQVEMEHRIMRAVATATAVPQSRPPPMPVMANTIAPESAYGTAPSAYVDFPSLLSASGHEAISRGDHRSTFPRMSFSDSQAPGEERFTSGNLIPVERYYCTSCI
jgi:hypothetical protein